jgi:hypothetical protein
VITFIYTYYNNPKMLAAQYALWASYPDDLKDQIEIAIVDDGSADRAIDVPRPDGLPKLRLYRVTQDIPWNQHGARNLGAREADDGTWLFLCDMDHAVPAESLRQMLADHDPEKCYRFERRMVSDPNLIGVGANILLLTKALFWRIGGYDEALCGRYGTDRAFRARFPVPMVTLPIVVDVYTSRQVEDAATTGLPRTMDGVRELIAERKGKAPVVVSFDWERQL